ncbi:MAG: DinB family protein [Gemmatimonadales bacterium]|nr:DinB family protein [Gemmatimonadales bacterium]
MSAAPLAPSPGPARPGTDEHAPYYSVYVRQVPDGDVFETLAREVGGTVALLEALDESQAGYRYAPGKWNVREVIGHVIDVERVFAQRALHFARKDATPLPSLEQDAWVETGCFDRRTLTSLLEEFTAVRQATLAMFCGFDAEVWANRGVASGVEFTARSMPYIIAGHEVHHRKVLEARYLSSL